jgi:anti-sigma factor RsiW
MTCEDVLSRLDEYVDGDLAEAEFQEIELHLAGCAHCRQQERELRALVAEAAALPREIQPARDLWPEVAARLRGAEGARGVLVRPAVPRWMRTTSLAAAAAVVIALSAALWTRGPGPVTPAGPRALHVTPVAAGAAPADLLEAEREYAGATADLMAALDRQKDALTPEARATLDANLKTIDDALAEVRTALRRDPGNAQLTHLLTSTHQKKIGALQRVVRLNRT